MSQEEDFRIKGAAQVADTPAQDPTESTDQPKKLVENADQAEEAEQVSSVTLTTWRKEFRPHLCRSRRTIWVPSMHVETIRGVRPLAVARVLSGLRTWTCARRILSRYSIIYRFCPFRVC